MYIILYLLNSIRKFVYQQISLLSKHCSSSYHIDASSVPPISNGNTFVPRRSNQRQIDPRDIRRSAARGGFPVSSIQIWSLTLDATRFSFRKRQSVAETSKSQNNREDAIAKQWIKFVWMQKETKLKKARNKNEVRFRVQWKWSEENGRKGVEKSLLLPADLPFLFFLSSFFFC